MNTLEKYKIFDKKSWLSKLEETYEIYSKNQEKRIDLIEKNPHAYDKNICELTSHLGNVNKLLEDQMLVVLCTYIESIIKDFLYTIITDNPCKTKYLLEKEYQDAFESFCRKKSTSKKTLQSFQHIAMKRSFNFDTNQTLNKICEISDRDKSLFKEDKKTIRKIFDTRNAIIHDNNNKIQIINRPTLIRLLYTEFAKEFIAKLDSICDDLDVETTSNLKKQQKEEENTLKKILGITLK